jgi:hypothetical protein
MPLAANRSATRAPVPGLTRISVRTSACAAIAARPSARSSFWCPAELCLAGTAEKPVSAATTMEIVSNLRIAPSSSATSVPSF